MRHASAISQLEDFVSHLLMYVGAAWASFTGKMPLLHTGASLAWNNWTGICISVKEMGWTAATSKADLRKCSISAAHQTLPEHSAPIPNQHPGHSAQMPPLCT